MYYQCYYYKTYGERQYLGEKILTEKFEKEIDAEIYCNRHGVDMEYDEVEPLDDKIKRCC